jgi:hypothetical protein
MDDVYQEIGKETNTMSVLDRDSYIKAVQQLIGEGTDETSIKMLEDFTDTFNAGNEVEQENWKTKYEENDKAWALKYKERFNEPSITPEQVKNEQEKDVIEDGKRITFEDLFKEREG